MSNEELKKKIVEIVLDTEITGIKIRNITGGISMAKTIADALIAAGIGDTSDLEVKCEVLQRDVDNLTRTMEEGAEELKEAQHRAEVAESALRYACWDLTKYYGAKVRQEWGDLKAAQYKNKAEKELAEEGKDE